MAKLSTALSNGTSIIAYGTDPGTVMAWDSGQYLVRWTDMSESWVLEKDVRSRKGIQVAGLHKDTITHDNVEKHLLYKCITGSVAYGLNTVDSDVDTRSIYLAPLDVWCGLYDPPETLERKHPDTTYYEIKKFCTLALKANPNILEMVYTDNVLHCDERFVTILNHRAVFLSKIMYQTYMGWFISQQKKLSRSEDINWKQYSHMIRLMISGKAAFETGEIMVNVGEWSDKILSVKRGLVPLEDVLYTCYFLQHDFQRAFEANKAGIPEKPDFAFVDKYLKELRMS